MEYGDFGGSTALLTPMVVPCLIGVKGRSGDTPLTGRALTPWRHSAAGVPFWSESIRRLYPFRRSRSATVHVRTATSVVIASSALVEVDIDPSQPLGPRVAPLESNLNAIRREMFKLNSELSQQASRFEADDRRIEKAFEDTFAKAAFEESKRAVVELRIAGVGLGITAFGALCQVPQIFVA